MKRKLRISWVDKVTNGEVLRKAEVNREVLQHIRKRQMAFLGHMYRKDPFREKGIDGKNPRKWGSWSTEFDLSPKLEHLGKSRKDEQDRGSKNSRGREE